jgi:mannose-6-phosphate isomerase
MLVKLLDTEDNLSVQVHPRDDDPNLASGESGKPEAWCILQARLGASVYLGFRADVTRADVLDCIARSGALNRMMNRVFVKPGDAFVIPPGTPHAIGAGVTLVEPQIVRPGCKGLTYRFWDWNRRYNRRGEQDEAGRPRHLHIERSMAVTDWRGLRGMDIVEACRSRAYPTRMPGRRVVIDWPWFITERWEGSHTFPVASVGSMWNLTCTGGSAEICWLGGRLALRRGQSAVIPAAHEVLEVRGNKMTVFASYAQPYGSRL